MAPAYPPSRQPSRTKALFARPLNLSPAPGSAAGRAPFSRTVNLSLALLFAGAAPALAQIEQTPPSPHTPAPREVIITAPYVLDLDILAGTSVLEGTALTRDLAPQIGDTLDDLPGVSATSFAPGASRPVLRGFQGERVRVLTDGIGSIDVSNTSADHAVTIDPLTAERVEVLRGPAVLLFGSQAIGGAVNVLDRRIPRRVPEGHVHLDALSVLGTAGDEVSFGGAVDVALTDQIVAHVDGSWRDTDDLEIGGPVLSDALREVAREEAAEGNEEAAELLELDGRLPNSDVRTRTLGGGLALINERGSLGFSVSYFDTRYGIPERPDLGHAEEEEEEGEEEEGHAHEAVSIDLEQIRADLRGEVNLDGAFLDQLRVRVGYADYEHTEFEGDEVGTVFTNDGIEGRVELVQRERGGWRGAVGGQFFHRNLSAVGEEAFLPPNRTEQWGVFTLQEVDLGAFGLEAGGRYERTDVESDAVQEDRAFDAFSAALSATYEITPGIRAGVTGSRSERAPSAEELFSNGPHIATQAFEIGDPNLDTEKAWGVEGFVRASTDRFTFAASVFHSWFDDFIYEAETGEEEDELPVFQYVQEEARYFGVELEATAQLFEAAGFTFVGDVVGDYIRATIEDVGPAPRIPPLRILGGLEAQGEQVDARAEVEWVDGQDRVAEFELPTDGHTVANASVAWRPFGRDNATALILSANNIFDVDVRRHASFLKDFAPLAGRDFRLAARVEF